ncbi:hypothetical protein TeGR_g1011, partial [Tetraparma gracilis]
PRTGEAARSGLLLPGDVLLSVGSTPMSRLSFPRAMKVLADVKGEFVHMAFRRGEARRREEEEEEEEPVYERSLYERSPRGRRSPAKQPSFLDALDRMCAPCGARGSGSGEDTDGSSEGTPPRRRPRPRARSLSRSAGPPPAQDDATALSLGSDPGGLSTGSFASSFESRSASPVPAPFRTGEPADTPVARLRREQEEARRRVPTPSARSASLGESAEDEYPTPPPHRHPRAPPAAVAPAYLPPPRPLPPAAVARMTEAIEAASHEAAAGGFRIWTPASALPPACREWAEADAAAILQRSLPPGTPAVRLLGGAALWKRPGMEATPWHQDFAGSERREPGSTPRRVTRHAAVWLALTATGPRSGCMRFAPSLGYALAPHQTLPRAEAPSGFETHMVRTDAAEAAAEDCALEAGMAVVIGDQVVHASRAVQLHETTSDNVCKWGDDHCHFAHADERGVFGPMLEMEDVYRRELGANFLPPPLASPGLSYSNPGFPHAPAPSRAFLNSLSPESLPMACLAPPGSPALKLPPAAEAELSKLGCVVDLTDISRNSRVSLETLSLNLLKVLVGSFLANSRVRDLHNPTGHFASLYHGAKMGWRSCESRRGTSTATSCSASGSE